MSIIRYLTLSVLLIFTSALRGGDSIYINISEINGIVGETVCVDITVDSFVNIGTFSLGIFFNPNVLEVQEQADVSLSCLNDPITTLEPDNGFGYFQETGQVRCVWIGGEATTFADNCNLFSLCFEIIGDIGDCSPIGINFEYTEFNDFNTAEVITETLVSAGEICAVSPELNCIVGRCNPTTGNNDGSYYFYAVGGSGPYMYDIDGMSGSIDEFEEVQIENQGIGNYPLTITDANGDMCSTNIVLFDNGGQPNFSATLGAIDPTCFDKSNGDVFIESTQGGVPVSFGPNGEDIFEVQWSNGLFNTDTIMNVLAGNYSVTLTDALGCKTTDDITLVVDTIDVMVEILNIPTCNGSTDGTIRVTPTGGTAFSNGDYDIEVKRLNDEFSFFYREDRLAPTSIFSGMPNGTYEIKVRDGLGCVADIVVIVFDEDPNFIVDIEYDIDPCIGGMTGVKFIPSIGTGWSTMLTNTVTQEVIPTGNGNMDIITLGAGLPPSTYCLDITVNTLGCYLDTCFTIPDNNPLVMTYDSIAPGCTGNTGSITVMTQGGVAPYTYSWSIDNNDGEMRDMLGHGTYGVTVSDLNGCSDSIEITFLDPSMIPLEATVLSQITCSGADDGAVTATVMGGSGFMFNWSDGVNELGQGETLPNLGAGTYYVTATDSQGCTATDSVLLEESPSNITVDVMQLVPSCANSNDGILSPTAMGGTSPYTFIWKDIDSDEILVNGQVFTGRSGDYKLCVSDINGCAMDTIITLDPPPNAITINVSNIIGVACYNECTGQAQIEAMGGDNTNGSFVYRVNGDIVANTDQPYTLTGLCPGENWVIASDASCPSDTVFFTIPNQDEVGTNDALNILTNPICNGESTGSIEVVLDGINANDAVLLWQGQGASGPLLIDAAAGQYILEISYGAGCTVLDTFNLVDPEELIVQIDPFGTNAISCNNGQTGRIELNVFGGVPGEYTYDWNPNVSVTNIANQLGAGTYSITVTDAGGCSEVVSHTLDNAPPVEAIIPTPDSPNCNGEQTCIEVTDAFGGVGNNFTFSINNGPRLDIDTCFNIFAGEYLITVFDSVGCSFDTTIVIIQPDELTVEVGPDQVLNLGETSAPISVLPNNEFPITSFEWTPVDFLEFQNIEQQIAIANPSQTTLYTVTVTDENGCTASDDVLIEVEFKRNVYFANAISPNGDEVNDRFQLVTGYGVQQVNYLYIYDRWGNKVYAEENYLPDPVTSPGWNGTSGSRALEAGVYIFVAEVEFDDGQSIKYTGDITLIK